MKLSQFKFNLPNSLLAERPTEERDGSRLMVVNRADGSIEHRTFKDILEYFEDKDQIVVNNTKVFPARIYGNKEKTGAKIEVFLLRELSKEQLLWDVLVDPARKIRIGNKLYFGNDETLVAEVIDNTTSRGRTLRFLYDGTYEEFKEVIEELGETPLPKYIKRAADAQDKERYQTIYAKHEGAVAAPTAGLHFSKGLLKKMELKGVGINEVTLHVGLGTFRSIEVEDLTKHKMDSEEIYIPLETVTAINHAKETKRKVCSIGTTTMRAIETSVSTMGMLKPYEGWTNKFIFPPYEFRIANCMVSNFHLPQSSLFMMVCAFGGYDLMFRAYKTAIKEKYRFFSYGDAMLIL